MTAVHRLNPPFSEKRSLRTIPTLFPPAVVQRGHTLLLPKDEFDQYLELEIKTSKLDKIHQHLWLAGLPKCARPLHRHRLMNRMILITENPDEHLVWHESRIFIKPLPEYLLCYEYWIKHLCTNEVQHRSACGLVLSYAWLVCYKSDLQIAKEVHVLPEDIDWPRWTAFIEDFLAHINPHTLHQVDRRYKYGELRLTRLNLLHRIMPPTFPVRHMINGFMSQPSWYRAFFKQNFGWLVAVFLYVTVVLSAMQVGLATDRLQENRVFQRASAGFASASIVVVLVTVAIVLLVWVMLFWYHLLSTLQYCKNVKRQRTKARNVC